MKQKGLKAEKNSLQAFYLSNCNSNQHFSFLINIPGWELWALDINLRGMVVKESWRNSHITTVPKHHLSTATLHPPENTAPIKQICTFNYLAQT